jgi:ankyrin repeat protein
MMNNEYEATALHDALEYNASVDVISELIEVGGRDLVMVKNINEWTALHDAMICNASVVNKLIEVEWRLLLNIKVNDEWTALLVAREKSSCVDVIN